MIYLDNSSTTYKKPFSVKKASFKGVSNLSTNPSRASYKIALKGANEVFLARENIANHFKTTPENVIFTSGCTMAINLALNGTAVLGGHIITTIYEHNSVLRTLERLKTSHNITVTYIEPQINGNISIKDIEKNINTKTYMIIINHTSNVTGTTQNIEKIGEIAKKYKLLFLVDAAQSAGHEKIDIKKFNINLLTIAGHKGFYGPQGIGALIINNTKVTPLIYGGTGTMSNSLIQPEDIPDGLESGTPNISGVLGLSAGINYVNKNFNKINNKIKKLTSKLISEIKKIKNIEYFGNSKSGIVSIKLKGKDSVEVSHILDTKYNIATRSGLHCAPLIHKYLNTTKNGLTRISISYFNNSHDIKVLIKALKKIALN